MSSSSVDWRNRWGTPWLTSIKDQGGCGSCYIFSAVGVVEAMTRIEHGVWSLRSEGDVGDSISLFVGGHNKCQGGGINEVLDWIQTNGIADPGCWPYIDSCRTSQASPDRLGRTVKIDGWSWISGAPAMKQWIDTVGPIGACFTWRPQFDGACKNNAVYVYNPIPNDQSDGHCIVIVGYDDTKQAWLIRNSWNTSWGTNGYGWFGYGQGENGLEYYSSCGVLGANVNPDPWTKRRLHNGNLYESGDGYAHRNFEVLAPGPGNVIRHFYQDGKTSNWTLAETLPTVYIAATNAQGQDCSGPPTLLGSTYFRDFEVIYQTTGSQLRQLIFDQLSGKWVDRGTFGPTDVDGVPGFVQTNTGAPGNFEIVVRRKTGALENWLRDNSDNNATWSLLSTFGGPAFFSLDASAIDPAVAHAVPLAASAAQPAMAHAAPAASTAAQLAPGVTSHITAASTIDTAVHPIPLPQPVLRGGILHSGATLCERWAAAGAPGINLPIGLDLVAVTNAKQLQRWFRDDPNNKPWAAAESFGSNVDSPPVMIRSQFGANDELTPGNYELCVQVGGQIQHWWTSGANPGTWSNSATFGTNVQGQTVKQVLGLLQSSYGFNLEVIAELSNGQLQHFYRDGGGWHAAQIIGTVN